MTLVFVLNLGLSIQKTNIGAQKIDSSPLKTYGMATTAFSV